MAYQLNAKVKDLKAYDPVAGEYQIRLDANESFIDPGQLFAGEIGQVVSQVALNRYPDASCKKLRDSFAALYQVSADHVTAGNGSDELISIIMGALLMAGDRLLTFSPDFSMYQFYAHTYEKQGILVKKEENLGLSAESIKKAMMKNRPQAVLFSNPCSPTSLVMSRNEVIEVIESASDCLVIVDEAYMEFSDESVIDLAADYDNLVVLKTCSKALGCAAIRLGFAVCCEGLTRALNAVRSPYNINQITQEVGALILSKQEYVKDSVEKILASREDLYRRLAFLSGKGGVKRVLKPDTNFVFLEMNNPQEVYDQLLIRSMIVRKLEGGLRITVGTNKENEAVAGALLDILGVKQ